MTTIALVPRGPFSLELARSVIATFPPLARFASAPDEPLRLAFAADGDYRPTAVAVTADAGGVHIEVADSGTEPERAARQVARILSLDVDGSGFPAVGDRDQALAPVLAALPGLRPVCFLSPYECAGWAVISQRIAMHQARHIVHRLVEGHGPALDVAGATVRAFPTPGQLLAVTAVPGLAAVKLQRLHAVARAALDGQLDADRLRTLGPVDGPASLRVIPGIGPFWSQGIYLRGTGVTDVFPDEPRALSALARLHQLAEPADQAALQALTEVYAPYRMWVCFLLRVADGRGLIPAAACAA